MSRAAQRRRAAEAATPTLDQGHDRTLALARNLDRARARDFTRDVPALSLSPMPSTSLECLSAPELVVGTEALAAAVTDFTATGMAGLDLRDIDLRGVRWSIRTTHGPPEWEAKIHEASVRIDPVRSPELYEGRDDPRVRNTV